MLAEKTKCSGCGLCEFVCKNDAIHMECDLEGFYYPQIDKDKCISCGTCTKKCPVLISNNLRGEKYKEERVYAGYQKDLDELLKSSSGGAAYTIAKGFIENGGVVIGVSYKADYRGASFIAVECEEELYKIRESKYVESQRHELYKSLLLFLSQGKRVLVIGLPCDIAAVKSLVGNDKNLYSCKLCCRGNTSNKVLKEFLDNLEKNNKTCISKLSLRYKEEGSPRFPTKCRIDFENGKHIISDFTKTDYGKAFQILSRESCFDCKAKTIDGLADLTLGDFQGANPNRDYYNTNGLSLIVEHNEKGKELKELLHNFYLQEMDYKEVMDYNWMAYASIPKSPLRDQFSSDFTNYGLNRACLNIIEEQNRKIDEISNDIIEKQLKVAMWGVGDTAEVLYDRFRIDQWDLKYVLDSSKLKIGNTFKGLTVRSLSELKNIRNKVDILIVMIPSESEEKLDAILKELGWDKPVIHTGKYKFYKR